ncbi:MAG: hypothetical protein KF858_05450 [Candidatus Sumerlaeia bacterium]|nr:hypothetical protein [Candidatus Sumerlaeia bacterium]
MHPLPDALAGLPDDAVLRVVPIENGLPPEHEPSVRAVLDEVLAQWRERGVIRAGAVALHPSRSFLLIAWVPTGNDLSGCTKDGLTHTLLAFEAQLGRRLVNAPRLAVGLDGDVRFLSQGDFRQLRRDGRITDATPAYDHLVQTLGALRTFETTVGASWYSRIPA